MTQNTKSYSYIVKTSSFRPIDKLVLRAYRISSWLIKRYKLNSDEVYVNYFFHDKNNKNKITIELIFKINE